MWEKGRNRLSILSEGYLCDTFQNDIFCHKLGRKFNLSHQGYACTSKFFGGVFGFLSDLKKSRMAPTRDRDSLSLYIA